MRQTTIGKVNSGVVIPRRYQIYVVRGDDGICLYVGQTRDKRGISSRLVKHVNGCFDHGSSALGRLIKSNWPRSRSWTVDCYEVKSIGGTGIRNLQERRDHCERLVIRKLRPCLNVQWNERPRKLPSRYRPKRARRKAR